MKKVLLGLGLVVASASSLAGYRDNLNDEQLIQTAEAFIAYSLKDPDSAKFRNVFINKVENKAPNSKPIRLAVCGEVNGKNAFGAYSGYQLFAVSAIGESPRGGIESESSDYGYANIFCKMQ